MLSTHNSGQLLNLTFLHYLKSAVDHTATRPTIPQR